jgi:UPF0755 protein
MRLTRWLAVSLAAVAGLWFLASSLTSRYAGFQNEVFVDIPKGTSTRALAGRLAEAGVIPTRWQFLLVRALRPAARLKAGEFLFRKPASVWEVFDRIARGDIFYYELTVTEGQNIFDIAASLDRLDIMPDPAFFAAARDPSLIRDLDPQAPSLEGYLFPDTYRLARHTSPQQLCRLMTERFRRAWQQLGPPKAEVHATVTLASLVEKEARLKPDQPLIASVFLNRLALGMPLQCDPTAIYAAQLEDRYRGVIHRSDLERKQLYNTYQYAGLPPGPIANPGRAALAAALHPAQTDYLYFVLLPDGSGGHRFSKELTTHERAVSKYRRALTKNHQTRPARPVPGPKPAGRDRRNSLAGTARAARANF